jgi:hypothetical protein
MWVGYNSVSSSLFNKLNKMEGYCKHVRRIGESCRLNNNCKYPECMKDTIVLKVIEQFKDRSELGIKKYNTTLQDNNTDDFLQHLKEELMDAVLYIEKLQDENRTK